MNVRLLLVLASVVTTVLFTYFSYSVAKERWQQTDFDTTVKLQDHISRRFDKYFSLFSVVGSVEVTFSVALIFSFFSLMRGKWLAIFAWLLILPASLVEVFGKLILYHPAPPVFLHRTTLPTGLPSFYIQTDFSYPSGHMTRTIFLVTIFSLLVVFSRTSIIFKLLALSSLMALAFIMTLTRVYLGEHWLSDVLGGGLLGIAAGLFAVIWILPGPQKKGIKIPLLFSLP